MTISHRLADALALAVEAHHGQVRKGTDIPYIAHPLAVASLVLEYGGSEEQAIAGLLHDAIEDSGSAYASRIAAMFGPELLALVEACSDGTAEGKAAAVTPAARKADWQRRKLDYLQRIVTEESAAVLVTACDKLHNARAILVDLERIGPRVFERFTGGREGTLWYYAQAVAALRARRCPVADDLAAAVARMHQLCRAQSEQKAGTTALVASLTPRQRGELRQLLGGLQASAQLVLAEGARALGSASVCQQQLVTLLQSLDADEDSPAGQGGLLS